ncbi:unnamed protein product [Lactuca virosa]|uniref:Secreted protein n=1 Tax=Lactuca virosa TaxID=75947 RepID=A0AAU9MP25_9ASTR|nr:unnamed protein product [Lactuca virosa]
MFSNLPLVSTTTSAGTASVADNERLQRAHCVVGSLVKQRCRSHPNAKKYPFEHRHLQGRRSTARHKIMLKREEKVCKTGFYVLHIWNYSNGKCSY